MTRSLLLLPMALAASCLAGSAALASSAFFVAERVGKPTIVMAEISTDEAYDPAVVSAVRGFDGKDRPLPVGQRRLADHVVLEPAEGVDTIVLVADFGFHARPADSQKWRNGRKTQLPGTAVGLHAIKESVNLLHPAGTKPHPHGLALEIIPLADPFALKRGDSLPVRVLLHGKPLADVKVQEDFLDTAAETSPPTDADGRTAVTLHADQFNVVQLTYEEPVGNDPDVDFFRYNTALTFNLASEED